MIRCSLWLNLPADRKRARSISRSLARLLLPGFSVSKADLQGDIASGPIARSRPPRAKEKTKADWTCSAGVGFWFGELEAMLGGDGERFLGCALPAGGEDAS